MDHFIRRHDDYYCEDVPLREIAAAVGTPAYIYSRATLRRHCQRLQEAFGNYPTLPCYAVKANSNLSILREIFAAGFGADLVSLGELQRAQLAGARPETIVFSGVGKRDDEIAQGLASGIFCFNVESTHELDQISAIARTIAKHAPISLRVNPNIDAKTHAKIATGLYTTKFGLPETELPALLDRVRGDSHLNLIGLSCHIGSQIIDLRPIREAAERMATLASTVQAAGHPLQFINMGGGLGIRYREESPPTLEDYAASLIAAIRPTGLRLLIEPGRVLVGNAGALLSRVLGVKRTPSHCFVVLDAAMNDLVRPSMYDSYHEIEPLSPKATPLTSCDFVGPICETGDFLGKDRTVPLPDPGDLFLVRGCGAYAASMASQYNSRPRAPEVLVDGASFRLVRPRERLEDLWAGEQACLDAP